RTIRHVRGERGEALVGSGGIAVEHGDLRPVGMQPVGDGGADAGGAAGDDGDEALQGLLASGHQFFSSQATNFCRWLPRPSMEISTTSPAFRYGYFPDSATPCGVPVRIRSPGSRVTYCERWCTIVRTSKMRSPVFESWRGSPLTKLRRFRFVESTSDAGTNHGPVGLKPAAILPLDHCPPEISSWKVRSDTSLAST